MSQTIPSVEVLVQMAEQQLAQYPQYRGHWNGWQRVRVTRDLKTKLGLAFRAGDVVLMNPTSIHTSPNVRGEFVMCYSFRNKVDTSIKLADTERID